MHNEHIGAQWSNRLITDNANVMMSFAQVENVLICCHSKKNPDTPTWNAFVRQVKTNQGNLHNLRTLVWTLGGGPTPDQRIGLNQALGGKPSRAAVISPHPAIRFIVSALSLTNRDLRVFSPPEITDALLYLGMTQETRKIALECLSGLRAQIPEA